MGAPEGPGAGLKWHTQPACAPGVTADTPECLGLKMESLSEASFSLEILAFSGLLLEKKDQILAALLILFFPGPRIKTGKIYHEGQLSTTFKARASISQWKDHWACVLVSDLALTGSATFCKLLSSGLVSLGATCKG